MRRRLSLAALLLLAVATLIGVSLSSLGEAPPTIRIGIASRPGHELLQLAQEKNLFTKEGANVRVVEFPSVGDARHAYERGQIDGLAGTLTELALLRGAGARLPVGFVVLDYSRGGDVLLAKPGVTELSALRERRIGIEPGTSGALVLARALASVGLDPGDVTLVHLGSAESARVLGDGRVDAVVTHAPASIEIERHDGGRMLFSSAGMPGEIVDLLMLDPAVLDEHPEQAAGIVRALERAIRRIAARPTDAYRLMGRSEGLSTGEMREAMEKGFEPVPIGAQAVLLAPGGTLERSLESAQQTLRASGELETPAPLEGALTPAIVERAGRG